MTDERAAEDVARLRDLWSGEFGDEYTDRNDGDGAVKSAFWRPILERIRPERVLEVGCNLGGNLQWIAASVEPMAVFGIDINRKALRTLRERVPDVNAVWSPADDIPFRDQYFDLVYTMGVLIHQPPASLRRVANEMYRCSRRYLLIAEYEDDVETEVPYRGVSGALYRRPYGRMFQEWFPDLRVVDNGFKPRDDVWDDHTWWLFERG